MRPTKRLVGFAVALGLMFAALPGAHAGDVLCKVMVGPKVLPQAVVQVLGARREPKPPAMRVVIDQKNKTFVPYVSAVVAGGTVEFRNSDDFLHNTYSKSKVSPFNFNQPKRGSRSLLKPTRPGIIEVRCHIHQTMQAWILVTDTPYFGKANAQGLLKIANVPAGTYTVKAWHPKHGTLTKKLTVPATGNAPVIFKYAK